VSLASTTNPGAKKAVQAAFDRQHHHVPISRTDRGRRAAHPHRQSADGKELLPNVIPLGPMYDAVTSGKAWRVKLALNAGADPNEPGVLSPTVLHVAAENAWLDVVRLLVENGADLTRLDSQGRTPASPTSTRPYVLGYVRAF